MRDEEALVALEVLDDAEDAAHQNQRAHGVQDSQVAPPVDALAAGPGGGGRGVCEAALEDDGRDHEEAEDDDLDEQAGDDDLLADVEELEGARGLDAAAAGLQREGDDIADDEHPRDPGDRDEGQLLSSQRADESAEDHVDGRGEERGSDQDENGLNDETADRCCIKM